MPKSMFKPLRQVYLTIKPLLRPRKLKLPPQNKLLRKHLLMEPLLRHLRPDHRLKVSNKSLLSSKLKLRQPPKLKHSNLLPRLQLRRPL